MQPVDKAFFMIYNKFVRYLTFLRGDDLENHKPISFEVKTLYHTIGRKIDSNMREKGIDSITANHGRILGFLSRNSNRDIYQRDIEKEFDISRSTVTNILQLIEKKGYIKRVSTDKDMRLKKLVLTEEGVSTHSQILSCLQLTDEQLIEGIPQEKLNTFYEVCGLIRNNCKNTYERTKLDD